MKKLLLGLFMATAVQAQHLPLTDDIDRQKVAREALQHAKKYTNYEEKWPRPSVVYTTSFPIPGAVAYYNHMTNEITVLERPRNEIIETSLLIHEMVHYLQFSNGKEMKNCSDVILLESEAYSVQKIYLDKYNIYFSVRDHMKMHNCRENNGKSN